MVNSGRKASTGRRGQRDEPEPHELSLQLAAGPDAAGEARREIERLGDLLSHDQLADLRSVVSELVANAVAFGSPHPVEVRIVIAADGALRGWVTGDDDARRRLREASADPVGRLGLRIVERLTSRCRIDPTARGAVWFELRP